MLLWFKGSETTLRRKTCLNIFLAGVLADEDNSSIRNSNEQQMSISRGYGIIFCLNLPQDAVGPRNPYRKADDVKSHSQQVT
jgi:hypothetical protein